MNKQTEALKMAIEALKGKTDKAQAIQACKEALAEPTIKENLIVRKPMNDENAIWLIENIETELGRHIPYAFNIIRAVEKAHGIGVANEQTN